MPRSAGARQVRWAVDLTPAELALVEAVRAAFGRVSRADFLLILTEDVKRRLTHPSDAVGKASALVQLERDEDLAADRADHGGRPPVVRLVTAEQWVQAHAALRSDPRLTERLAKAIGVEDGDDIDTNAQPRPSPS